MGQNLRKKHKKIRHKIKNKYKLQFTDEKNVKNTEKCRKCVVFSVFQLKKSNKGYIALWFNEDEICEYSIVDNAWILE